MKKHRGLFLGLGLAALIAAAAPEAQAGPVTIVITWGASTTGPIDFTSPFALPTSTADNLQINVAALNGILTGSAYNFANLGATSNNPGATNANGGAVLKTTGTAQLANATGNNQITISAFQSGFTSPSGIGTLTSASTANYTNATVGDTEKANASFNTATITPPLTYMYTGQFNPQSYSGGNSIGGLPASSAGYTLDNTTVITMALTGFNASNPSSSASDQFTISSRLTAVAVPEPAGLVMMVTGMPLPLVVMGLLRRRRAAA